METLDSRSVKFTPAAEINWENLEAAAREVMARKVPATPEEQLAFLERYFPSTPHVKRLEAIEAIDRELALLLV